MTITINGKGPGAPSSWRDEYIEQVRKLCKLGMIDEEIAEFLEVSVRTLHRWKISHPALAKAMKAGKKRADDRVVRALYHRAVGFTFQEEKVFQYEGSPVYAQVEKFVIPDVRAAQAWLVNRCGWRMNPTGADLEELPTPEKVQVEVIDGRLPPPEDD